jgi:predicted RNA-binding Zn ribbon-like protein
MNANEWLAAFAERIGGAAPNTEDFKQILDLAGVAAHSSERVAAPAACWVAANAGVELEVALRAARELENE